MIIIFIQIKVSTAGLQVQMRKGHRRTQSAYIAGSDEHGHKEGHGELKSNQITKLLQASQNKVGSKVINYERLEVSSLQENNYLKFGNFSMAKVGITEPRKLEPQTNEAKLNCIPENSKSSELSSQKMSKQGGCQQDDIPVMPVRKMKPKRGSDFKRLEVQRNQKSTSQLSFTGKKSRFAKSLKKR